MDHKKMKLQNRFKSIFFMLMMILPFCFGTSFAGETLTLNEFRSILNEKGINIYESTEIPTDASNYITSKNPVIISSSDNKKVYIYETTTRPNKYSHHGFGVTGTGVNTQYYFSCFTTLENGSTYPYYAVAGTGISDMYAYCYVFNSETQTFSNEPYFYIKRNNSINYSSQEASKFGFQINVNNETEADFKNISTLKRYLENHLIFSALDVLYYNSQDVLYKFDGVFTGNEIHDPYTSSFVTDEEMWRFNYTAYTDLNEEEYGISNYFYLQELSPSQAITLTKEDIGPLEENFLYTTNFKVNSNFSFASLIKKMQEGYIYRLLAISNTSELSGDAYRSSYATSQFFSLNSWKSSYIEVLNIYDLVFPTTPDIEQVGGTSSDVIDLEKIENEIGDINTSINDLNNFFNEEISGEKSGELERCFKRRY